METRNYRYPYLSRTCLTGLPTLPQPHTSSPPTSPRGSILPCFWLNHLWNHTAPHSHQWLHFVGFQDCHLEPIVDVLFFPSDGAGVDILDLPFWRDALPRQSRSWTIIPSGGTSWVCKNDDVHFVRILLYDRVLTGMVQAPPRCGIV